MAYKFNPFTGTLDEVNASGGGATTPGGADTQVQFNNNGAFAGSPNVTFDGTALTADQLSVTTSVNSALIPDTDATYDLGSATNKWRDLYLDNNSLYLGDAVLSYNTTDQKLEINSRPLAEEAGYIRKPILSGSDPDPVDQGQLWSTTLSVDSDLVGVSYAFYDYTGTSGTYNAAASAGTVGGIENTPGTYTIKARAAWPFGISDELTLNVIVNAFTLNQNTMFGGIDGLQGRVNHSSSDVATYIAVEGAFANDGSGYVWDIDGSVQANCANSIAFYEYTTDKLIGFRVSSSNVVEGVYLAIGVTSLPTQGAAMPSSYTNIITTTSQKDAAIGSSVLGRKFPLVAYYSLGAGSQHYLTLTPSSTEFDGFGSKTQDWSFGFRLVDDWVSNGYASQLLAPSDSNLFFVNAITGFGIGSSPYEYIHYGNATSGPFSTSTNGATWNIATNNWLIGNAGDLVVVTYDGTGTDTYKVYVEGVLIYSSTDVDTYMPTGATSPTSLEFGNFARANGVTSYPANYNKLAGWYARLNYIFTSVGTAFNQTQVTELTSNKADLTASTNYGSIDTLGTFTSSGVENTKGSVTYARGDFSF